MAEPNSFISSTGEEVKVIDGDTFVFPNGDSHRLTDSNFSFGIDARETDKLIINEDGEKEYIAGQVGGDAQTKAMLQLIERGGFKNINPSGEKGSYGRFLSAWKNDKGLDLASEAVARGILEVKPNTSSDVTDYKFETELLDQVFGQENPYKDLKNNVLREKGPLLFKELSLDEQHYDPDYHSGVMFRDHKRTLDNKATGVLNAAGIGWRSGIDGVKEGWWGYMDAIGQTTNLEMLENLGERGLQRAKDKLQQRPEILLSLKDIDGVWDVFPWLLNNAAASAPYMMTTLAMGAAAVPAAALTGSAAVGFGVATLPLAIIYAGHTWNEMEGVKGPTQFATASSAGVGIAMLERLGIRGLVKPEVLLTKGGVTKVAQAYKTKMAPNMDIKDAEKYVIEISKQEQAKFIRTLSALSPEDIVKFSMSAVGKRALVASGREALTEFAQEATQAATAATFSDKEFTREELEERFINAAAAGGALGFAFGGAGGIYSQGKSQVTLRDSFNFDMARLRTIEQQKIKDLRDNITIKSIDEDIVEKDSLNDSAPSRTELEINSPEYQNAEVTEEKINNKSKINLFKKDGSIAEAQIISKNEDGTLTVKLKNNSEVKINIDKGNPEKGWASVLNPRSLSWKISTDGSFKEKVVSKLGLADINSALNQFESLLKDKKQKKENTYDLEYDITALKFFKAFKENNSTAPIIAKPWTGQGEQSKIFVNASNIHENTQRGVSNFLRNNDSLDSFVSGLTEGIGKLWMAAERYLMPVQKLVQSKAALAIYARVGQTVSGVYHSGMGFKQYYDQLVDKLKVMLDENNMAKKLGFKRMTSKNALIISTMLRSFGKAGGFELYQEYKDGKLPLQEFERLLLANGFISRFTITPQYIENLFESADIIKRSYDIAYVTYMKRFLEENRIDEATFRREHPYNKNYWWKNQGFDWKKVLRNPVEFKAWLDNNTQLTATQRDDLYESVAFRGANRDRSAYSLVEGTPWRPFAFSDSSSNIVDKPDFDKWSSQNMFEALNKVQVEVAKYDSTTKYFGEGGRKLNELFYDLQSDVDAGIITQKDFNQMAWYTKAIIDSTHGNFKRIKNPTMAAINNFMTTWAMFAGLPLATLSSIPETAMIYFNVKDDEEWKQASARLSRQMLGAWNSALNGEVAKTKMYLDRVGLREDANTIVDRLATGERDITFAHWHETFFRVIMIKQFTQFQRRMNAGFAVDFIQSGFKNLELAPQITDKFGAFERFDFDNFQEIEMRTYTQLSDLGINVEEFFTILLDIDEASRDSIFDLDPPDTGKKGFDIMDEGKPSSNKYDRGYDDWVKEPTKKEQAFLKLAERKHLFRGTSKIESQEELTNLIQKIDENIETAIYRFVNERIQLPQAANRPLFFQDPHYQLLTQFNGFISTFTANIIPKLWNQGLRKGTVRVKYDTFALVLLMLALGGASQWLKDQIKFGKALEGDFSLKSNDYFDMDQYIQRALYSSGILGQGERVVDLIHPLYPDRDDWIMSRVLGEAGPAVRNISNVVTSTQQMLTDDTVDRGLKNLFRSAPYIGPVSGAREVAKEVSVAPFRGGIDINAPTPDLTVQDIINNLTR